MCILKAVLVVTDGCSREPQLNQLVLPHVAPSPPLGKLRLLYMVISKQISKRDRIKPVQYLDDQAQKLHNIPPMELH